MKHLLPALVLAVLAVVPAMAQDFDAERKRIRQERAVVTERYQAQEQACYRRFAVTDCIQDAGRQRNEALADLRRQEVVINDTERKRRAAERLRVHDADRAERARADDPARRARAAEERQERAAAAAARARSADEATDAAARQARPRTSRAFEAPRPDAAEAARNRERFEARRKAAETHKADVLERAAARGKPPAPDLPTPPR